MPCTLQQQRVVSLETKHAFACKQATLSTWCALPSCSFSNTQAAKPRHRELTPAATRVPALAVVIICVVTSLASVTPQTPQPYVQSSDCHSFRKTSFRFLQTEHGSICLPSGHGFSKFGSVSTQTNWLPSRAFRVELFTAEHLTQSPERHTPTTVVTNSRLPLASQVKRPPKRTESPGRDLRTIDSMSPHPL